MFVLPHTSKFNLGIMGVGEVVITTVLACCFLIVIHFGTVWN